MTFSSAATRPTHRRSRHHQRPTHSANRCPASGKIRYRDHREAVTALHATTTRRRLALQAGLDTRRRERRAYFCPGCQGWHLTSQELG